MIRLLSLSAVVLGLVAAPLQAQDGLPEPAARGKSGGVNRASAPGDDCEVYGVVGQSMMTAWQNGAPREKIEAHWSKFDGTSLEPVVAVILSEVFKVERQSSQADRDREIAKFQDVVVATCMAGAAKRSD